MTQLSSGAACRLDDGGFVGRKRTWRFDCGEREISALSRGRISHAILLLPLERLGLIDDLMQSGNPRKYCVQFVRQDGFLSQPFYFFQHFDHPSSTTWQVWRSDFDKMILDKARQNGASFGRKPRPRPCSNPKNGSKESALNRRNSDPRNFCSDCRRRFGSRLLCRHQAELDGP